MLGIETLDVLIGLVTVYLAFGLACTAIVEAISAWFGTRSRNLETALSEFFAGDFAKGQSFLDAFYAHPLVQSLSKGQDGRPSYIPPEVVVQVVEALITANGAVASLETAIESLPGNATDNRIKGMLETFARQAKDDAAAFRSALERHFNASMDRASGWFKRRAQAVGLVVSALLVIGANADTVNIASSLTSNNAARVQMVEIAGQKLQQAEAEENQAKIKGDDVERARNQSMAARRTFDSAVETLQSAGLPLGWKGFSASAGVSVLLAKVAGLVVSIFAVSLGAPFWFDVLQRFMQVRAAGTSPKESTDAEK